MTDDSLRHIEAELMRLPLRRPALELDGKIAVAISLAAAAQRRRRLLAGTAVLFGAAASLLAVAAVVHWSNPPGQQYDPIVADGASYIAPIQIEQVWSSVATEPQVVAGDGHTVRIEQHVVRQIRWIDETRNIRIQWEFPSVHTETMPLEYGQWPVEYN